MKTETLLIVLGVAAVGAYFLMRKPAAQPAPQITNVTREASSNKWDAIIAGTREAGSLGRSAINQLGA
jgi:hypothetical protein